MKRFLAFFLLGINVFGQSGPAPVMPSVSVLTNRAPPSSINPYIELGGYYTNGDGGGGRFYYDKNSTNTIDNGLVFGLSTGVGRYIRLLDGAPVTPQMFGARSTDLSRDDTQIQAAIDAMDAAGGGEVFLPPGVYSISNTIVLKPNVWLRGSAMGYQFDHRYTNIINLADVLEAGVSVIHLVTGANCTMLSNSFTGNYLRTTFSQDGRGTVNQYTHSAGVRDIVFDGNASGQTRYDCHAIHIQDIFGFWVDHVTFYRLNGRMINVWNANSVKISDIACLGDATNTKGILLWDTSDTIFAGASMESAVFGPAIWLAGSQTWFNNVIGGHWGDTVNQDMGGILTNVALNVFTTSGDVLVETGEPVVFWEREGTLPTGATAGKTYFAIRYSTNQFAVASNITNAWAGVPDAFTDYGSNAVLKAGPNVPLYMSDGAQHNTVSEVRLDNGFDGGVIFENANYNSILNSRIMRSGMFSDGVTYTNNRPAFWIRNGNHNILDNLDFWNNPGGGLWIEDTLNIIGAMKHVNSGTNLYVSQETFFPVYVDQTGKIRGYDPQNGDTTFNNLNFRIVQTNTTTQPLRIEGGGTVSIAMERTAGVEAEYNIGLTAINSVDGMVVVNVEDARQTHVLGGDADESYLYGGVVSGTPFPFTVGAQPATGSNIAGAALILTPTRSTGTGTNGGVLIRGFNPTTDSAAAQTILNSARIRASSTSGDTDLELRTVNSANLNRVKHDTNSGVLYMGTLGSLGGIKVDGVDVSSPDFGDTTYIDIDSSGSTVTAELAIGLLISNVFVAGANMTLDVSSGTNIVFSSSGGGGATNGTAVSLNGSAPYSILNFINSAEIAGTASGASNVYFSIVANSIATNKIDSTFYNWINGKTSVTNISDLADVTTGSPAQYEVLLRNSSEWTNGLLSTNSISAAFYSFITNQSGGGGTTYTGTNGVTVSGSVISGFYYPSNNIAFTTNGDGSIHIAAIVSTNSGTSVSVNGGSVLSVSDFDTSAQIAIAESGGNITATIVDGSLGTNEIDATFHGLLVAADNVGAGTNLVLNGVLMQPAILTNNETAEAGRILWVTNASGHIRGYATNLPAGGGGGLGTNIFVNGTLVQPANIKDSANVTWSVSSSTNIEATFTGVGSNTNGYYVKNATIVTNTGGDGNVTHYTVTIPGDTLSENGDELAFTVPGTYITYPSHVEEYFTWQFTYDGNPTTLANHQATNSVTDTSSVRAVLWDIRIKRLSTNTMMVWTKWDIGHGSGDDFTQSEFDQLRVTSSPVTLTGDWGDDQDFSLSAQHDGTSGANEILKTFGYTLLKVGAQGSGAGGGSGDVVGPASSTTNAVALFDGTTGKLLKSSLVTVDGYGGVSFPTNVTIGGVTRTNWAAGYVLMLGSLPNGGVLDSVTRYVGWNQSVSLGNSGSEAYAVRIPKSGTIKAYHIQLPMTAGSSETVSSYIRVNGSTDYGQVDSTWDANPSTHTATNLSVAVDAGDTITFKFVCPAWATNPANVYSMGWVYIE